MRLRKDRYKRRDQDGPHVSDYRCETFCRRKTVCSDRPGCAPLSWGNEVNRLRNPLPIDTMMLEGLKCGQSETDGSIQWIFSLDLIMFNHAK